MKANKIIAIILSLLMIISFISCSKANTEDSNEIITQKVDNDNKIPITVLVKYAFTINFFEKELEEKFPQIDLIQVGNYTTNSGVDEYAARLEHNDLTDIVMTWPLEVGEEYWADRLINLSSLPFTGDYVISMLDNISRGGELYYLPGPSEVRGILYNKTMFAENGWEVPNSFDSFIKLCKTIEESGMRSLQLPLKIPEVLDTAFVGFGYSASFAKPENTQWLANYNNGSGSLGENFSSAIDTFGILIAEGILKKEDLNIKYGERARMLFNRECAMVEDSVLMARMGFDYNGNTDEFAIMPFFNPGEQNDWARLYPVCYIGANKELENKENKEKLDLVMQILEYISTPEGQMALSGDTGAMFSALNGVEAPDIPEIHDLIPALTHGRYAVFPTLKNAQGALRTALAGMLKGEITEQQLIRMVDKENSIPPIREDITVLGNATQDFSLIETGNFITDTMRKATGCNVALYLDNGKDGKENGKGVSGRIYSGDITLVDINRILTDVNLKEKCEILNITMTGENLLNAIEYSLPVLNVEGWFYYFSGLRMEFSPSANAGSRVINITDLDGNEIDKSAMYTVAIANGTVDEKYITTTKSTQIVLKELIQKEISEAEKISPSNDGRLKVVK